MPQRNLGERVARLEAENEAAKPLHERFHDDIAELKQGQAEICTTLKILVTNGHAKVHSKMRDFTAVGGGAAIVAGIAAMLREFGV